MQHPHTKYSDKKTIHTTLPAIIKKKVKEYGKGSFQEGIINLIQIAEAKEIAIHIDTTVILN